ncbi:MAG: hypothetical protein H6574_14865 [Lewinellaceae bacterium]|nr:hypothetical protein [Saprospiraceae bacterium]MCB9315240.1 hypothetical protein [Lewinellaceae bacterium]MCB9332360.1 hypothetical protein [Lewinellaceae bacterium]
MSNLEFIIELLDKTIWPITIFIILFLIRKPLKELMPLLKKAKISELELEFDRELAKAKEVAETGLLEGTGNWKVNLLELARNYPNTAILEAWKEIEDRTEKLLHKIEPELELDVPERYKKMQTVLSREEVIETKNVKVFNELRQIRNKVAHAKGYDLTQNQALGYISLAIPLIEYLEEKTAAL